MNFSEEEQQKISRRPLVVRMAFNALLDALKRILSDECSEDALADAMATVNNNNACRFADSDFVNYEEAAKILGISATNRTKLKHVLDMNGIKQFTMNNQKVGFKRSDIVRLYAKLYKKK